MLTFAVRFVLTGGLCSTALLGCTDAPGHDPAASGNVLAYASAPATTAGGTSFSEQEQRAALLLSIGKGAPLESDSSPYEQALRCRTAVEVLSQQFRQAGAQGEAQSRALAQATAILDQRLRAQAALVNKSDAAIRRELDQAVQAADDLPAQGQMMIACLQQVH